MTLDHISSLTVDELQVPTVSVNVYTCMTLIFPSIHIDMNIRTLDRVAMFFRPALLICTHIAIYKYIHVRMYIYSDKLIRYQCYSGGDLCGYV